MPSPQVISLKALCVDIKIPQRLRIKSNIFLALSSCRYRNLLAFVRNESGDRAEFALVAA